MTATPNPDLADPADAGVLAVTAPLLADLILDGYIVGVTETLLRCGICCPAHAGDEAIRRRTQLVADPLQMEQIREQVRSRIAAGIQEAHP